MEERKRAFADWMLTHDSEIEDLAKDAEEVAIPENSNPTIRIVAGEDGKFKIVLKDNSSSTPTKLEQDDQAFAAPAEAPAPAGPSTPAAAKKGRRGKKRSTAEASTAETVTSNSQGSGVNSAKTIKKSKYERKVRPGTFDAGLGWPMLHYQPNMPSLQAQLGQELAGTNPILIPYLANAYAYNENLTLIRSKIRKEKTAQILKKALTRLPFNQNQNFQAISYKPGSAFVQYQNKLSKPVFFLQPKPEPKPAAVAQEVAAKKIISAETGAVPAIEIAAVAAAEPKSVTVEANVKFICSGCQRDDTKKYAKNLCQTCYKKQRKTQEDGLAQSIKDTPKPDTNGIVATLSTPQKPDEELKEWTGTCPDCGRSDVKHYAKGKCTNCYRKSRKRINARETMPMELAGVLATGNNN